MCRPVKISDHIAIEVVKAQAEQITIRHTCLARRSGDPMSVTNAFIYRQSDIDVT
ncbi:MAG: mechanosensitive ion channel domain-containing protein [Paracoccus sp. (in: a-proteobacteria)]|uniref:mechanosensitive ion channel domain-containing protein n=1 Tax=Paracoccus sp. TaxID=267 RepID=UPI004059224F